MSSLIMCRGLPASGKTSWAKIEVRKNPQGVKRINKDDLRKMIHAGEWSQQLETLILTTRDMLVNEYLFRGYDVIVDDTNLAPKHEETLRSIADRFHARFEIQDFTDVPVNVCIERDMARSAEEMVGKEVIIRMWKQYLANRTIPAPLKIPDAPELVICDIDGTIATNVSKRGFYDWARVGEDAPRQEIVEIVKRLALSRKLIFVSGRKEQCREATVKWLKEVAKIVICCPTLYMRADHDNRPDTVVKQQIYEDHIQGKYNVVAVVDDRPCVIRMWRSFGLPVLDVGVGVDF